MAGKYLQRLWRFIDPVVDPAVHDEYVISAAHQVQLRSRLLFAALFLTTPTAALVASPGASIFTRIGAPAVMALTCLAGFISTSREIRRQSSSRRSLHLLRNATCASSLIAVMCSSWCVYSWFGADSGERIYYPLIVAMGAFSTAFCLSAIKSGARAAILINIVPMIVLMVGSGSRLDLAAAVSLGLAALFQLHMIGEHQRDIVRLLTLQNQSRELARIDPLTGLLNRRALLDHALALGSETRLRLMLIDIDHFKAINDGHGHDTGDAVLVMVAELLARRAEIRASVARIGGEEFAILGSCAELPAALALGLLNDIRTADMPHARQVTVSLGLADGPCTSEADWRTLFNLADAALYKAKQSGRNRMVQSVPDPAAIEVAA
ncbi:diguanylate cyclase [Novosphingobium sp.]|uniref:GGDEF domain-containing protein n=1 Tax=Novosphingobium sp. TaxID=1874826 RepID=UPI0025D4BE01|nr:diguanylate cyclase [Novosphingobium sp.]